MIDIHAHILPGIDDGAKSLEESLIMAEMAVQSGVRVLVATPHSNQTGVFENYESTDLKDLFQNLQKALYREKIPLKLARGMEIFCEGDVIRKISDQKLIGLNHSAYFLVEFPFDTLPWKIESTLHALLDEGKIPVIAHPERYYCVQDRPQYLYEWQKLGVLSQMNKASIFGKFGPRTAQAAEILLEHHLVHCIASDAHRPDIRTTDMREIENFIIKHDSEETARILLEQNPARILLNRKTAGGLTPVPVSQNQYWVG